MKTFVIAVLFAIGAQAGVVKLVTPPVVQKTGSFCWKHTHKVRHVVKAVVW